MDNAHSFGSTDSPSVMTPESPPGFNKQKNFLETVTGPILKPMETAPLLQHHQSLLRPASSSSSFSYVASSGITTSDVSNPHSTYFLPPHQNVMRQQSRKYLTLTTAAITNQFRFQFNQPRLFCAINSGNINNSGIKDTMADNSQSVSGKSTILNGEKEEEKKELEKSTPRRIPPPPEKPLPDDCCGSGCVRCVWDIYYEELEAYNKLYKTSPDSRHASSEQS